MITGAHAIVYSADADADLTARGVTVEGGIVEAGWGRSTTIRLPGGGAIGLYEPRHPVAAGLRSVVPRMVVDDVATAVAFLRDVFGPPSPVPTAPRQRSGSATRRSWSAQPASARRSPRSCT